MKNKEAKSFLQESLVLILIVSIFFVSFVFAAHTVRNYLGGTMFNASEDISRQYNITINNTDTGGAANITKVNITLPDTFTFFLGSNATSVAVVTNFTNTSNVLTWVNGSDNYVIYANGDNRTFGFNATASTPGNYTIQVWTTNSSGSFNTNLTVKVNDTTAPSSIAFVDPTPANSSNLSRSNIDVNVTATDNGVISLVRINLYAGAILNQTNTSATSPFIINYTGLSDGVWYINATVNDSYGNSNSTITRTITLDTVVPNLSIALPANNTNLNSNTQHINYSAGDTYINTCWYSNDSMTTNTTLTNCTTNITDVIWAEGNHTIKIWANDSANNINSTKIRFFIDTIKPLISFGTGTAANSSNLSQSNVYVNVSVTEINEVNVTFRLWNSTGEVNTTNATAGTRAINWTGLPDGNYTYNVSVGDLAGNSNSTITRTITLNTTKPYLIGFVSKTTANLSNLSQSNIYINISAATKDINISAIIVSLYNSTNLVNATGSGMVNSSYIFSVNFTNLTDGIYYVNATVNDTYNNKNFTSTYTIALDNVGPIITFDCSPDSINPGGTVTCLCTANDSVFVAGTSGVSSTVWTTTPDTSSNGIHTEICIATDYTGNAANSSTTYTVTTGGTAATGGGGGISGKTYTVSDAQLTKGLTKSLASGDGFKLSISGAIHYVTANEITSSSAKITISSTPQTATLSVGDLKKFDVTEDGYYDLSVKLNSIKNNKADLTIKSIHEKIPAETPKEEVTTTEETVATTELPEEAPRDLTWLWVTIGIIVILILIGIGYKYKNR